MAADVPTYDPATRQIVKDSSVPASAFPPVDLLATADALSRVIAERAADLPEGGLTSLHNAYVVLRELARGRGRPMSAHGEASSVIEQTGLVHLGSTPGECWGWECALCDSASGLAFGEPTTAAAALTLHLVRGCEAAR